ncbi:MAG: MOSC N-terminal beta barrel domain-containing protein [Actinomycetota bacterium]
MSSSTANINLDLTVSEIWRYPIKSVGGEQLSIATVTEFGILGDRGWGIHDTETDTVLTARRTPELLFASAALDGEGVAITLPDETTIRSSDDDVDERLSAWLDRPVTLQAAGGEGGTYEVPLDFENDEQWVSWKGPGGAWHDSGKSRVSLVSRTSLREWEASRFRANVILDGAGEDDLVDATVQLGSTVTLDVQKRIDRCVIVTRPQPGLERDLDVLRTINAELASCLSVGALVTASGTISMGDTLVRVPN